MELRRRFDGERGDYNSQILLSRNLHDGDTASATAQIVMTEPIVEGGGGVVTIALPLETLPEIKIVESLYVPPEKEIVLKPPSEIAEASDVVEVVVKSKNEVTVTVVISKVKSLEDLPRPYYDTYKVFEINLVKYSTTVKVDAEGIVKFRVSKL